MSNFIHLKQSDYPGTWSLAFFGDLVSFRIGKTPARGNANYWNNGTYPWVSISDMGQHGIITQTKELVSEIAHRSVFRERLVPAGHYLMSFKLTIGRISRLGISAYHNEAIISFLPDDQEIDPEYLAYFLAQINYRNYQDTAVKGMTLNSSKLAKLEIACPPLEEQRKIGAVLCLVQRAIEQQDRLIQLTTELKKALMHKLFTEGVYGESLKETEIGPVPESWQVVSLGRAARLSTGTTPSTSRPDYYDGNIPFIKTADIVNNEISKSSNHISPSAMEDYNLVLYPPGTLLMAMYGQGKTRGQVGLLRIPATTTQNAAVIQPDGDLEPEFLWFFLRYRYEELRAAGALGHISHLNLGYLRSFPILKPPIKDQIQIVRVLDAVESLIRKAIEKRGLLESLFRTLLHQLMTAQIRVDDLDTTLMEMA
jgi:type I restriction enzyme S subunit